MREQLKVYLVTGRYDFSDTEFLKRIETACRSGVTWSNCVKRKCQHGAFTN